MNGMRIAGSLNDGTIDIDVIPSIMVQRIDVVADGASATYGADAVAGTVNLIYREPFDGMETEVRYGVGRDYNEWHVSHMLGTTWSKEASGIGEGGLVIAYDHSHNSDIAASYRSALFSDDLTSILGAAGLQPTNASPGNVTGLTRAGGVAADLYAVPGGVGSTQGVTLADLGAANVPNRQSVYDDNVFWPNLNRDEIAGNFKQEITPWLSFFANGFVESRNAEASHNTGAEAVNISVPSTNPYSPCTTVAGAPGLNRANAQGLTCPANNTVTVRYNTVNELGNRHRVGSNKAYNFQTGFEVKLPYEWHSRAATSIGYNYDVGRIAPRPNTTALNQVVSGVNKPTNVPFFNPFCDNRAAPCNDPVTDAYFRADSSNIQTNRSNQFSLAFDGPLFELPGGKVRVAVGGEYLTQALYLSSYTTQEVIGVKIFTPATTKRFSTAYFAELYVPIIGEANAIPFVKKLELTLAGRLTDYSDFGETQNPKVGINWSPLDDLKLRASYGTSFRAPGLRDANPGASASLAQATAATAAYTGITGPAGTISTLIRRGGTAGLNPEKATTWTFGADWTPEFLEGFHTSATYYKIKYIDRIGTPVSDAGAVGAANAGYYDPLILFNPTYFPGRGSRVVTQAEFDAEVNALFALPLYAGTARPTNPVLFVGDGRAVNGGKLNTDGIDFKADYDWDMDWGAATAGLSGTYVLHYDSAILPTAPFLDFNNLLGNSIKFRARASLGLTHDAWSGNVFVNYVNPYENDPALLPAGTPAQYFDIDAYTSVDMSLAYSLGDEVTPLLRNVRLQLNVKNAFDAEPPFALGVAGVPLYDGSVASAQGRLISLQLNKKW